MKLGNPKWQMSFHFACGGTQNDRGATETTGLRRLWGWVRPFCAQGQRQASSTLPRETTCQTAACSGTQPVILTRGSLSGAEKTHERIPAEDVILASRRSVGCLSGAPSPEENCSGQMSVHDVTGMKWWARMWKLQEMVESKCMKLDCRINTCDSNNERRRNLDEISNQVPSQDGWARSMSRQRAKERGYYVHGWT